jgi:hypothetical protein
MKYINRIYEVNEDWADVNTLSAAFGIKFIDQLVPDTSVPTEGSHELIDGLGGVKIIADNAVPFSLRSGTVLAGKDDLSLLALIPYGGSTGEILVLADLGMLGSDTEGPANLAFWRNLVDYLRSR